MDMDMGPDMDIPTEAADIKVSVLSLKYWT
jgi:hypothetical protein